MSLISKRLAGKAAFKVFCTPFPAANNNKNSIFNSGESLEFTVNNTLVKGFRFNKGGSKRLLILHGFSSTCRNFHWYITTFIQKGYEVLAFDAPAHGASSGRQVNALDYSAMIQETNRLYGPFNGYMAHSFGGISVSLALEQIPHNEMTKLALIAPATETVSAIDDAFIMLRLKSERIKNALKDEIFILSGHKAEWFSIRRAMKNITADVLWIHDEDDDVTPLRDALKVKEDAHANVRFVITTTLGHRKIYRDEAVKKQVVDFFQWA
ncbi:alpha/beta hydrolase [Ferruginibacter sp. HRS2-29]|uniref:alpha/beta hydrolase n=1 Tax=Ferruginibacter sp. HRS2-29 TaxID=2487334 RepID=UPI0020CECD75|nr:alpha/beta fold hydrolase [Ferruginibacter sp. HRS2-29]